MPAKGSKPVLKIIANESLPIVLVDQLAITSRTDGMHFVRFMTALPEGHREQCRMMIPDASLRRMLDVLCRHCDHYPERGKGRGKVRAR
jgi:hypothetical protein